MLDLLIEFLLVQLLVVDVETLSHFRDCSLIALLLWSGQCSCLVCLCIAAVLLVVLGGERVPFRALDVLFDQVLLEFGS